MTATDLFMASLIHIPIAGTSLHPKLLGIVGIIWGKRGFPFIFSVLLFQTLLFQYGDLLTLELNSLNMSTGAFAVWLIWRRMYRFFYLSDEARHTTAARKSRTPLKNQTK